MIPRRWPRHREADSRSTTLHQGWTKNGQRQAPQKSGRSVPRSTNHHEE